MGPEARIKLDELVGDLLRVKGLEFTIGKIIEEWEEAPGPTPMPGIETLREWDLKLLKKYRPFYLPFCDLCCLCTMGKCDLTRGKHGACGIDIGTHQSRFDLITACIGTAAHCTHARDLVDHLIEKYSRDHPIDVGGVNVELEAPNIRLVTGIKPTKLGDLEHALEYCEAQIVQLLSATHMGQEGDSLDFESKIFHAGMIDHVALEIADIVQISTYNFPKAEPETPLAEIGMGTVDASKPVILVIGHNVPSAAGIIDYMKREGLEDKIELCGLCCTAHDASRHHSKVKIIGPLSWQLRFIRSGIPDIIIIDMQCIRTDVLAEARKIKALLITTSSQDMQGLPNLTQASVNEILKDLLDGGGPGAFISDPEKTGEVVVRLAMELAPRRKKFKVIPDKRKIIEAARKCTKCGLCRRACQNDLLIPDAMVSAGKGDLQGLVELYDSCIACGRCETVCPLNLLPLTYILGAAKLKIAKERSKMRVGRGAIQDTEIRHVGYPIVVGEIPGVVAFVGCSNYPGSWTALGDMVEEFAKRRYIVTTSGCAAMSIGLHKDEGGNGLYEKYPGAFDGGGLVNVGSCVANSHISGAAIKIASIFAKRKLRANYEEIADYVHNRVGAVGVAWGAYSQKAFAIAAGFWRLGVPVIVGPHGAKYRRMLLGRKDRDEDWYAIDARTGKQVYVGPAPEHLFCVAETKEEAMVMIPKLCMRPSDTPKGRAIKLTNYIDIHRRFYGTIPDDIHLFVRSISDIPITMKDEVTEFLEQKGWKEGEVPDPTLLPRLVREKKG
ncbi:MAG: CO dehydrogenase/acetyl-CoA synthase complex subunit alpha [Candidatus Bathyarchaeia archaeon]